MHLFFLEGSSNPDDVDYSTVVVGKNVTLTGWSGVFIDYIEHNGSNVGYGIVANIYGTLNSVKDTSGYGGHALYVNGSLVATEGNIPKITLDGAKLNTVDGNGMYLAGFADTTIINSTIKSNAPGNTGIEIRAGKLYIENSSIIGGSGTFTVQPNGNGSTTGNVALAVVQHTTKLPLEITVKDGVFSGGAAVYEENAQQNDDAAISKIKMNIEDGDFEGIIYSQNKENFIYGGLFDEIPDSKYISSSVNTKAKAVLENKTAKYIFGENALNRVIDDLQAGDSIEFEKIQLGSKFVVPAGVEIINNTGEDITVNNVIVADGATIIAKEPESTKPSDQTDDSSVVNPVEDNQQQTTNNKLDDDKSDTVIKSESPSTGDDTLLLCYVIMMLSAMSIGGTILVNRKKK